MKFTKNQYDRKKTKQIEAVFNESFFSDKNIGRMKHVKKIYIINFYKPLSKIDFWWSLN